jgi:chromosomal replication initiator protein
MLNGLRAMNEFCSENLDLGAVKRLVAAPGTTGVVEHTIKGIAETVAMEFGSDLTSLVSKRQDAGVALPRKVSMFLSREMTNSSLADIGSFFNRDYSSVIAAIQSLTKQMDKDENLARRVKDIRYLLEA